jgi:hypothetical protein
MTIVEGHYRCQNLYIDRLEQAQGRTQQQLGQTQEIANRNAQSLQTLEQAQARTQQQLNQTQDIAAMPDRFKPGKPSSMKTGMKLRRNVQYCGLPSMNWHKPAAKILLKIQNVEQYLIKC